MMYLKSSSLSVRRQILCQNFSDLSDKARLVSIIRYDDGRKNNCDNSSQVAIATCQSPQQQQQLKTGNSHLSSSSTAGASLVAQRHQPEFLMLNHSIRNVLHVPRRKFLSAITVLVILVVSIFCFISSSLVDILISSSSSIDNKYLSPEYQDSKHQNGGGGGSSNDIFEDKFRLEPIELDEIMRDQLEANYFNGTWIGSEAELAFYDSEFNLCLYDVRTGNIRKHIKYVQVLTKNLKGLQLSGDQRYLLWSTNTQEIFRHSKIQRLQIYDIHNDSTKTLFDHVYFHDSHFQLAEWGPHGSQLVFVYENNLYYKHSVLSETVRLSVSGVPGIIYNGHTDWLYEEEILNSNKAFWFSPRGGRLVYLQLNDTLVESQLWNHYGDYENVTSNQYPDVISVRYPKPGRPNPQVLVFVVNLNENAEKIRVIRIEAPKKISNTEHYVSRVVWFDEDRVLVAWTERQQTRSILVLCGADNHWKCQELYELTSATGWVDGFEDGLVPASNLQKIIIRIPRMVNNQRGEYYHVATVNIKDKSLNYLTNGPYDVVKLISYSPATNEVFYASTLANHPEVQHIMKISLEVGKSDPVCLTCYLGNSCRFNEAHFNPSATYYVLECKGYEIPRVELRDARTNELIELFDDNQQLFRFLQTKYIPRYEKIFVKLADNYDAIVEFILPHNFDENHRYPMVMELYGAPGTQQVKDKYEMNHWSSHLTSKHQYLYAKIDVRGTSNQGLRHMHQLYKNVGRIEVDDLITVVWFLKTNLTYVDPNRIALWGWSYGAYISLMALARPFGQELFSCSIAVAPVTNWMFYDSAYTEKYLGDPNHRPDGLKPYIDANLLEKAERLKSKKFLIIFGTGDDNVHSQHSMSLIRELNRLNAIDYEIQIYPDDNHYLTKSSTHLHRRMINFIQQKCFV